MEGYKNYNQMYYQTKYKEIVRNKTFYCDCCKHEYPEWNRYKHLHSNKHRFNAMTIEEQAEALGEKEKHKYLRNIQRLTQKIENIEGKKMIA